MSLCTHKYTFFSFLCTLSLPLHCIVLTSALTEMLTSALTEIMATSGPVSWICYGIKREYRRRHCHPVLSSLSTGSTVETLFFSSPCVMALNSRSTVVTLFYVSLYVVALISRHLPSVSMRLTASALNAFEFLRSHSTRKLWDKLMSNVEVHQHSLVLCRPM